MTQKRLKAKRVRPRTGRKPGRKIKGTLKRAPEKGFFIELFSLEDLFEKPKAKKNKR